MLPDGMEKRNDTNKSVYNHGVISKLITDTVQTTVKKKWQAAAFQSQLRGIKVEFTLQSREVGITVGDWEDSDTKAVMDDFFAEQLIRTVSQTVPKYDQRGIELEYRWVEIGIYQKNAADEYGDNLLDPDTKNFVLQQNNSEGTLQEVSYYSELDEKDGIITNRIADKINYTVEKKWEGDTADQCPASIEIHLYRDNVKYAVYQMNGKTQVKTTVTETDAAVKDEVTGRQDEAWKMVFDNLPKYEETGHRYSYYAEEVLPGGYHANYEFDIENRITKITNTPRVAGRTIRVRKEWIDDGDDVHRIPVKVEVYNKDTNEIYGSAVLTEQHFWWEEIGLQDVPETVKLEHLAIRELEVNSLAEAEFDITGIFESDEEESTRTFTADGDGIITLNGVLNECNEAFEKEYIYKDRRDTSTVRI